MPKNARKMIDRYKQIRGYKICANIFSMQASLNYYWLEHLNLLREQARAKGELIARLGVDETEKANIYANDVYPNNQHMDFNSRGALLAIQ